MHLQTSLPRRREFDLVVKAGARPGAVVRQIIHQATRFFRIVVDALEESGRRKGDRILRRYRHLLDDHGG